MDIDSQHSKLKTDDFTTCWLIILKLQYPENQKGERGCASWQYEPVRKGTIATQFVKRDY